MVDNCRQSVRRQSRWARFLAFVLPPCCLLCRARGHATMDLCAACTAMLPRPPATAAACPLTPGCVLSVAALEYAWPVDQLVQELKFGGCWPIARVFGQLLADARRDFALPLPQAVIPVPLHPRRLAERGFNQAEHIARFTAATLAIPLAPQLLQRRRNTAVQSRLGAAARRDNLRDAFVLDERRHARTGMTWQHVALVDDVRTTGSTLAAATRALREGGVKQVEWWTAAATTRNPQEE